MNTTWNMLLLSVLLLASGCGFSLEQDGVALTDMLVVEQCDVPSPFEMNFHFFAYSACNDTVQLRFQGDGKAMIDSDGISIQLEHFGRLAEALKLGPVTVTLPDPDVEFSVYLNHRCSENYVILNGISGTVILNELDPGDGGKLDIVADVALANALNGEEATSNLHFEAQGELSSSTPYQDFSVCPR